mmetsp:Transcript_20124/g.43935  ORF Transcript_20124/g.43935 Transcript_20124/m.43935 type:complete len:202 (-) Transcript_20124:181-786(-)
MISRTLFLSAMAVTCHAFVAPLNTADSSSATALSAEKSRQRIVNRRIVFGTPATILVSGCLSVATAAPVYADVTNKVASTAALRAVKKGIKDLENAEFPAVNNEYADVKAALRTPALNEVRKNCLILIKGGEDGPEAENLKTNYNAFVKALEALDTQASLGMRGRKEIVLASYYDAAVKSLRDVLEVGERSATIPLQDVPE